MKEFLQKHAQDVIGVLSGFDRVLFRGTIRMLGSAHGMHAYLWQQGVRLTEFAKHVHEVSTRLKEAVVGAVEKAGRPVVYLTSAGERKDVLAREIAERDGVKEGPVCLLTSVEPCPAFEVRPNREVKKLELRRCLRKCLFLYRYEIHPVLGFMHARIQSWFPFSVQIWINGREWLARQMDRVGLGYQRRENCFVWLQNPVRAQKLMDQQLRVPWARTLDRVLDVLNPIRRTMFGQLNGIHLPYYWSTAQTEWATDVLFRDPDALARLYPRLVRHAITSFGSPEVMRFLGRKVSTEGRLPPGTQGEIVTNLHQRPEGVCVKHRVNRNGIKVYDKQGSVLRIETTIQEPGRFKVYRTKEGDPRGPRSWRPLRHGIADLHRRCQISQAANQRYGAALNAINEDASLGELTRRLCQPAALGGRRLRGLRPWAADDLALLSAVGSGAFLVSGLRCRDLVAALYPKPTDDPRLQRQRAARICRLLRILRAHGLIKKVPRTHRYMLTVLGRRTVTAVTAASHASVENLTKIGT